MRKAQVTVPLNIPDVHMLGTEINKVGGLIITIESTKEGTICHRCGDEIRKRHGYDVYGRITVITNERGSLLYVTIISII